MKDVDISFFAAQKQVNFFEYKSEPVFKMNNPINGNIQPYYNQSTTKSTYLRMNTITTADDYILSFSKEPSYFGTFFDVD